jgi:hypothetical protein
MNPTTSVEQTPVAPTPVEVEWTSREVRDIHATALREMSAEKAAAGDQVAARELERMASQSEASIEVARREWASRFAAHHERARGTGLEAGL